MSCAEPALRSKQSWAPLAPHRARATAAFVARVRGWLIALARMHERSCQRRTLRDLDEHLLRDIGVTREQAEGEARKPFWR
jgi:uncharacterized protein YjiS (DUF1127 family)